MNSSEFIKIRRHLGKSQSQMAGLLGISPRAVQSFEQQWRSITVSTERQTLFLLSLKVRPPQETQECWEIKGCDLKTRKRCPAWEFKAGYICWFINGTICDGKIRENWNEKMQICRQCGVFRALFARYRLSE